MTHTITLTPSELEDITGYQAPARQVRELRRRGWVFEINAAGRPIVSRAYAERRLGGTPDTAPAVEPNFGALQRTA